LQTDALWYFSLPEINVSDTNHRFEGALSSPTSGIHEAMCTAMHCHHWYCI